MIYLAEGSSSLLPVKATEPETIFSVDQSHSLALTQRLVRIVFVVRNKKKCYGASIAVGFCVDCVTTVLFASLFFFVQL